MQVSEALQLSARLLPRNEAWGFTCYCNADDDYHSNEPPLAPIVLEPPHKGIIIAGLRAWARRSQRQGSITSSVLIFVVPGGYLVVDLSVNFRGYIVSISIADSDLQCGESMRVTESSHANSLAGLQDCELVSITLYSLCLP